uniref:Mannosyl-oligosaccharide glucosidase n=1 Tax=Diabrotica virgifera virgifera TaxID=50390 RepID=A0A6P7FTC3_DIAVI
MVRQRERRSQANSDSNKADKGTNSSSSNGSSTSTSKSSESVNLFHYWKQFVVVVVLSVAVCFGYMGYLETRINTPFDDRKVVSQSGLDVPELFWGSYRPGAYFGLKTRDPTSLVTGLMWYFPLRLKPGGDGISSYSILNGELYAILQALKHISNAQTKHSLIISDSLNSLRLIQQTFTKNPIVILIKEILHSLHQTDSKIVFLWVPSHSGIEGNENADRWAYTAAQLPTLAEQSIPAADTKQLLKSMTLNLWSEKWKTSTSKLRDVKEDTGPWNPHTTNRSNQVILSRLRSGPENKLVENTILSIKQKIFLAVSKNKKQLIQLLCAELNKSGYRTKVADEDADVLIVQTALHEHTYETNKTIVIIGVLSHESFLSTTAPGLHLLKETVISSLRLAQDNPKSPRKIVLGGQLQAFNGDQKIDPNLVAIQLTGKVPFTIDISYESGFNTQESLNGNAYTEELEKYRSKFVDKFEKTFKLKQKGYQPREIKFAEAALSNMIGGIGYFYGSSRVQSDYIKEPVYYWRAPLYTAVPSRSFFPRGFLWDEGFHGFLISKWSLDMELDIMSHWFDLMNVEGWIPREQILGIEALAKVPSEFVVQKNTNANPPTFFLTLESILDRYDNELNGERFKMLERLYPRLQAWFAWFNTTQKGTVPGSYRWRGRDATSKRELNPKTLTSGLDDYPRASHPTDDERHIDLYCWMAIAAKTMARLAKLLGNDGYKYEQTAQYLLNNELMDRLHWSDHAEVYADYGLHTDAVKLQKPKPLTRNQNQNLEMQRVVMKKPEYRLVDSTYGYVSLFPFMLQILDPKSPKLEKTLEVLIPRLLTPYGLQSLSKDSPLYGKRNTEHDPPYWRGQVWIPINYLATKALHHYSKVDGPYKELAKEKYQTLRSALIKNVIDQYYKTGYIWEHYNEKTGEGGGARPFNGWSALVVLLLGEEY